MPFKVDFTLSISNCLQMYLNIDIVWQCFDLWHRKGEREEEREWEREGKREVVVWGRETASALPFSIFMKNQIYTDCSFVRSRVGACWWSRISLMTWINKFLAALRTSLTPSLSPSLSLSFPLLLLWLLSHLCSTFNKFLLHFWP